MDILPEFLKISNFLQKIITQKPSLRICIRPRINEPPGRPLISPHFHREGVHQSQPEAGAKPLNLPPRSVCKLCNKQGALAAYRRGCSSDTWVQFLYLPFQELPLSWCQGLVEVCSQTAVRSQHSPPSSSTRPALPMKLPLSSMFPMLMVLLCFKKGDRFPLISSTFS